GRGAEGTNGGGSGARDDTLRRVTAALRAAAAGDFDVRLPARRRNAEGDLEAAFNELVERNARLAAELQRAARIIGREGRMTERARLDGTDGEYAAALAAVNGLVDDLA